MPTSIFVALIAYGVSTAVGVAVGSVIIGAIAGGIVSYALNAAFSSKPEDDRQQFTQELRDNLVTVRQPIANWRYVYGRTRVGGALTFGHESADQNFHMIVTYAGHVCEEIEEIHFNDEVVPLDGSGNATGKYAGYVRIQKSLGDEAGQPFPDLVAESEGKWTDAHRQSGRCKVYARLTPNADLFPTGLPNITAVIKGRRVYDPRSTLTAWSDNASLCQADYVCDAPAGLEADYATEIDEAQLIAAANIDDEAVALAAGGTEARYALNGSFLVDGPPRAVLESMLTANAGAVRYIGGLFLVHPAAFVAPAITLTTDDCRAVPRVTPRLSAADLCNGVKGIYTSEDNLWQPTDFPPVTNATYLAEDENERAWLELNLPYTKSVATAQRIAKIELERRRQQISVNWPGKFTCYRLQAGNSCGLTFSMLGWSAKAFEVQQSTLTFEDDGDGGVRLGCDLALRETASSVFDWNSGEETTVDPAPDTNLPDAFTVAAPGTPSVTETIYETTGSAGVKARATVSWGASSPQFEAGGGSYELEYKAAAETDYTRISAINATTWAIEDVAPGIYNFRVRAVNTVGVHSAYSAVLTQEIVGLSALPATPANVQLQIAGGLAILTLDRSTDLDVRIGGKVRVRHSEASAGATWEESLSIGNTEGFPGDSILIPLPLKAGTYLVRFEDSTFHESADFVSVVTKQSSVLTFSPLDDLQEDDDYLGVHDNTIVDSATLTLGEHGEYLSLSGASGNFGSTGDSAALDITGTIDIRWRIAADDFTPAAAQVIGSKWLVTGNQRSYYVDLATSGNFGFTWSANGSSAAGGFSFAPSAALANGSVNWGRIRIVANDGAGNRVGTYLESTDGVTWTQIRQVSAAGTVSIYAGTALLNIGAKDAGTSQNFAGKVYDFEIYNSADTLVADFDCYDAVAGASLFVSSATGETYTVNTSGSPGSAIVTSDLVMADGVYTFATNFDFLAVKKVRVTGQIEAIVANIHDSIDARTENIDTWLDFDGDVGIGSLGDAWLEARQTDDDPGGAPTWSEWNRCDAGEFEAWGMEFRLQMRSYDPAYNVTVDALRVKAEEL